MIVILMRTRDWQEPAEEKCSICWQPFYLGEASAVLVSDDDMEVGEICPACIAAGPEKMQRRLDIHAELARQSAEEWERIASEGVDYIPTTDELLLAEDLYSGGES